MLLSPKDRTLLKAYRTNGQSVGRFHFRTGKYEAQSHIDETCMIVAAGIYNQNLTNVVGGAGTKIPTDWKTPHQNAVGLCLLWDAFQQVKTAVIPSEEFWRYLKLSKSFCLIKNWLVFLLCCWNCWNWSHVYALCKKGNFDKHVFISPLLVNNREDWIFGHGMRLHVQKELRSIGVLRIRAENYGWSFLKSGRSIFVSTTMPVSESCTI